jgi:aminoglycoside phosphotransferase (APT) family kinase protein
VTAASPIDDLEALAEAIERRFPELRPARPLAVLGSGFRSVAVETPAGAVLRVGQSQDAAQDYAKEWRMGPFLARALGAVVPEPRWYAEPCSDFPHGMLGYQKLPGETPEWGSDPGSAFARDLGAFMARLHTLDVAGAVATGVPEVDSYRRLLGARDVVTPVLGDRLDRDAFARIEAWWASFAADARMRSARRTVCHHDLWHDNLLRSAAGRLSGVLDMAHVEIGDPAHDCSAPGYFGEAFMNELLAAYRDAGGAFEAEDAYRARRFSEGREFGGLAWAVEHNDEREIASAIEKILAGPIVGAR